jgi:agmatine deiminase
MIPPIPAEWSPHSAMWVGFPSDAALWEDDLADAQAEVAALARTLAGIGGERVKLMACGEAAVVAALDLTSGVTGVEVVPGLFGDVWLRDTGPIFRSPSEAAAFRFNGWGGKYELPGDEAVADEIAKVAGARLDRHDFVLEGGALDHDGAGTILTTRQCLLNPNRNPGWDEARAEAALAQALGARRVVWLDDGLVGDHTDGHVDNLARFVAPGVVACPAAFGDDDPHGAVYAAAATALSGAIDAEGRALRVVRIPAPGRVTDPEGEVVPASHMNFLIANGAVIVPVYGEAAGKPAVRALTPLFPDRSIVALASRALLTGGGSFHCISQQEPAG